MKEHIGAMRAVKKEIDALTAFQKQIAGVKLPDFSAVVKSAIPDHAAQRRESMETLERASEGIAERRNQKDREDAIRTRALESLARDAIYTRIAAIAAAVAALAGIVTVILMAWSMIEN